GFAFAGNAQPRTGFDACRYFQLDLLFLFDAAFAAATFTRIFNYLAASGTGRTGSHYAEKTLLIPRLAAAAATRAGDGRTAFFRSAAGALATRFEPRYLDSFSFPFRRFFERDLQIVTQIRPALHRRTRPSASAENIAETEHV